MYVSEAINPPSATSWGYISFYSEAYQSKGLSSEALYSLFILMYGLITIPPVVSLRLTSQATLSIQPTLCFYQSIHTLLLLALLACIASLTVIPLSIVLLATPMSGITGYRIPYIV